MIEMDTPMASQQLVVFALSSEHYALPIGSVSEIIRATPPRSVASENIWIRGVIGLRGRIIPIFDLGARLGLPAGEPSTGGKIVIIDSSTGPVGVLVDDVEEVLTVDADQFEEVPVSVGGAGMGIGSIARLGERLVMVLDVNSVLDYMQPETELAAH